MNPLIIYGAIAVVGIAVAKELLGNKKGSTENEQDRTDGSSGGSEHRPSEQSTGDLKSDRPSLILSPLPEPETNYEVPSQRSPIPTTGDHRNGDDFSQEPKPDVAEPHRAEPVKETENA